MTHPAARVTSFAPVADARSRVLVLGSMPGIRSLQAQQYYAHPRNGFWPILGRLLEFDPMLPYEKRIAAIQQHGIALWDVLQCCTRSGSLDSAIETGSRIANDFESFFRQHRGIRLVCFNGAEAGNSYARFVRAGLRTVPPCELRLPSTSPANAAMSFETKLRAWRGLLQESLPP